jgi:hypothetical protein
VVNRQAASIQLSIRVLLLILNKEFDYEKSSC